MREEPQDPTVEVTRCLNGDLTGPRAERVVYETIRAAVRRVVAHEPGGLRGMADRPQWTAVVDEVWRRLAGSGPWASRAHFMKAASTAAWRFLTDVARKERESRRCTSLDASREPVDRRGDHAGAEVALLADLVDALAKTEPRAARIATMRLAGGLSTEVIAEVEQVDPRTIERGWAVAKVWLVAALRARMKR